MAENQYGQFVNFDSWIEQGSPVYSTADQAMRDKWAEWIPGSFAGVATGSPPEEIEKSSAIAGVRVIWEAEGADQGRPVETLYQFWSNRGALLRVQAVGLARAIRIAGRYYGLADRSSYVMWYHPHPDRGSRAVIAKVTINPDTAYASVDPVSAAITPRLEPAPQFPEMRDDISVGLPGGARASWASGNGPILRSEWLKSAREDAPFVVTSTPEFTYHITAREKDEPIDPEPDIDQILREVCSDKYGPHYDDAGCVAYRLADAWREATMEIAERVLDVADRFSNWLRESVDNR